MIQIDNMMCFTRTRYLLDIFWMVKWIYIRYPVISRDILNPALDISWISHRYLIASWVNLTKLFFFLLGGRTPSQQCGPSGRSSRVTVAFSTYHVHSSAFYLQYSVFIKTISSHTVESELQELSTHLLLHHLDVLA